jgi:hypothetical protein
MGPELTCELSNFLYYRLHAEYLKQIYPLPHAADRLRSLSAISGRLTGISDRCQPVLVENTSEAL